GGIVTGTELAGRLDNQIDVEVTPRQHSWVALLEQRHSPTVDEQGAAGRANVPVERAERRVVLEQMRQRRGVPQVVDPNDDDALVEEPSIEEAAQIVTADTAEPVDRHTVGHVFLHYLTDRSSNSQVISSMTATTPSTARVS